MQNQFHRGFQAFLNLLDQECENYSEIRSGQLLSRVIKIPLNKHLIISLSKSPLRPYRVKMFTVCDEKIVNKDDVLACFI